MIKDLVLDFKSAIFDDNVSKGSAAIVVGILSGFMAIFFAVINGLACSGNLEDSNRRMINFPEYARIYQAILCGLYCLLIPFCCLVIYGVMKKIRLLLRPWGVTLAIIIVLNLSIFIAEVGFVKKIQYTRGYSLAQEIIQEIVFTIIGLIMLATVRLQCNHLHRSEPSTRY